MIIPSYKARINFESSIGSIGSIGLRFEGCYQFHVYDNLLYSYIVGTFLDSLLRTCNPQEFAATVLYQCKSQSNDDIFTYLIGVKCGSYNFETWNANKYC